MINLIQVALLFILCLLHGYDWYLNDNAEKITVQSEVQPRFKALIGHSPRIAGVAYYWKSKSKEYKKGPAKEYLFAMHQNTVSDYEDARYYLTLGEKSMSFLAGGKFFYRERWDVVYEVDQSELVASFGDDSLLVMNLEQIKFPQCKVNGDPIIMILELIDASTNLAPAGVTVEHGLKGWRVRMNVADEYDISNLNRRVLVKRGCREQGDVK